MRSILRRLWRVELSTQIIVGLLAGVAAGLFFGELCAQLSLIGDGFVALLQMTVLPYIAVSLVASLGRLSWRQTRRLAATGGIVLMGLWAAVLLTVSVIPAVFPPWNTGSFFSTSLIQRPPEPDLLSQFIPANIFEALARNYVPGIILFCLLTGLALAQVNRREGLLQQLDVAAETLMNVSWFITRLAPIGVFAIAASTAGTMSWTQLSRIQAYLIAYSGGAIFLGVIVLPLLVTTLTPLNYRQVLRVIREPALTALATGKLIIVLPMLIKNTEALLDELSMGPSDDEAPRPEVLYATAYPFPNVGKLLTMLFVPFSAWFLGKSLPLHAYPEFLSLGLPAYFGGPLVAMPFLLDQMRLPQDMFALFLVLGVVEGRLSDALGVMHLATFTLISSYGFRRGLKFQGGLVLRYLMTVLLFGALLLLLLRVTLSRSIQGVEDKRQILARLQLLEQPVDHVVLTRGRPNPQPLMPNETLLQRIKRRGVLRVGYNEDKVPFAYFNGQRRLVGFDINMAHSLARDLGVTLEFVRFDRATVAEQLQADHFDIVMSGLVGTLERSAKMLHTRSYLDLNLAFVVPDYSTENFSSLQSLRRGDPPRIGVADLSRGFAIRLTQLLPEIELVEISSNQDFFTAANSDLDALLISAESGAALTLMNPDYAVVIPDGLEAKLPLFYAIAGRDSEMQDFLEYWITLRQKDGTASEYYDYWILGKSSEPAAPRWSVIRDVLHWID